MVITALSGGGDWINVWDAEQTDTLQNNVETAVKQELAANYVHIERKKALFKLFKIVVNERLVQSGSNDDDPQYRELRDLIPTFKSLIGLPDEDVSS